MPAYSAQFAYRVLVNLQTALESNLNGFIDEVSTETGGQLSHVGEYKTPIALSVVFPCLYLEPIRAELAQAADDSHVSSDVEIGVEFSCVDGDFNAARLAMVQYAMAVDRCIRQMTADDMLGDITSLVGAPVWEPTGHVFNSLQISEAKLYRRDFVIPVRFQFMER